MEKESFEDVEVAKILNESFIAIKVDREERPDLDNIYMEVCLGLTGSGGWPLTLFLTPDKKPFFAGTYFPKHSMGQHSGLIELLTIIREQWKDNKSELVNSAEEITRIIKENIGNINQHELDEHIIEKCFNTLEMTFDPKYGGFGSQPKFPTPHNLLFLLRYGIYHKEPKALEIVEKTLIQMYKGGIFDHIGYGFSRYSVDNKWLVPHFEKMLYDNAILLMTYIEAYQLTHKELYKDIAEKIITFVLNEMTSEQGAFYTAIDADSEGEEGKFYLWTINELKTILTPLEYNFLIKHFNVTDKGNFEGKTILNLIHWDDEYLFDFDNNMLEKIHIKLYNVREKRIHPHVDDKILTSINALMISSFALAGKIFNNQKYLDIAETAHEFIMNNLVTKEYRILARYREGEAKYLGYLDDYAYFISSLIELFLATGKHQYIDKALDFNTRMITLFEDVDHGGFFQTGKDSEELIMKTKSIYDGAIPSANSVVTMNLLRLAEITDDISLTNIAREQFKYFSEKINWTPQAYTYMLSAYLFYQASKRKIVLVADKNSKALSETCAVYNTKYLPFTTNIILHKETLASSKIFTDYHNFTNEMAAYICEDFQCNDPIFSKNEIINTINKMKVF